MMRGRLTGVAWRIIQLKNELTALRAEESHGGPDRGAEKARIVERIRQIEAGTDNPVDYSFDKD